jgi:hypothetical protein
MLDALVGDVIVNLQSWYGTCPVTRLIGNWRGACGIQTIHVRLNMGKRGTDLEQFLMQYPHLLRWVNECLACHHKGHKPEMPEPDVDIALYIPAKLRRLADELVLDEDGLCQQCRQAKLSKSS